MPPETLERYFPVMFAFSALWVVGWAVVSIFYRRSRGKPIVFRSVANAVFAENTASGHSNRSWWTKLGGASRCLVVAVTENRLIIRPTFPFNLMFLPEIYGLEHDIPTDRVTHVDVKSGRSGSVRVTFRDLDGESHDVTLYLRNPVGFVNALAKHTG